MIRHLLAAVVLSVPLAAQAQETGSTHSHDMNHGTCGPTGGEPGVATEPGQGAFAAIQEIVAILEADPGTDWSRVDIERLRRHLVDMSNVTLHAEAAATSIENGVRYVVTGTGPVRDSIRRMVKAHAETMSGVDGMTIVAEDYLDGAMMTVTVADPSDLPKLEALGFIGLMTLGMHHQAHHLMIAAGSAPHD